jgi:hypothetical protein
MVEIADSGRRGVNEALCRALAQAALSEVDVAARLEVDPKTVRRWIDGRLPYLRHRLALGALLGLSQADLWPQLRGDGSWPEEVSAVYPHLDAVPHEVWLHMIESARHEVDLLACAELLTADGLVMNALLARPTRHGMRVRICIGEHGTLSSRAIDAVADRGATCLGKAALALVSELQSLGSATVRVHEGIVYNTICRADNELLAAQHAYGIDRRRAPAVLLSNVGKAAIYGAYARSFDQVWATARRLI